MNGICPGKELKQLYSVKLLSDLPLTFQKYSIWMIPFFRFTSKILYTLECQVVCLVNWRTVICQVKWRIKNRQYNLAITGYHTVLCWPIILLPIIQLLNVISVPNPPSSHLSGIWRICYAVPWSQSRSIWLENNITGSPSKHEKSRWRIIVADFQQLHLSFFKY